MLAHFSNRDEFIDDKIAVLIKELSHYGLGVFQPHKHCLSGALVPLPSGEVALESDLHVSFVSGPEALASAVPVGWRWNGVEVEVCAACCSKDDTAPPT